jgi:hypothetical protein
MTDRHQIAHDLALAYVYNRHGAEVTGDFKVSTFNDEVSGEGDVHTERLVDVDEIQLKKVGTGETHLWGLREKKQWVEDGFKVDRTFERMLDDYFAAYERFTLLLAQRGMGSADPE